MLFEGTDNEHEQMRRMATLSLPVSRAPVISASLSGDVLLKNCYCVFDVGQAQIGVAQRSSSSA
jgi:hypothetical protein